MGMFWRIPIQILAMVSMIMLMMTVLILMFLIVMNMFVQVAAPLPVLMIVRVYDFVAVIATNSMRTLYLCSFPMTMSVMRMRTPMVPPCMLVAMQHSHDV